MTSLLLACALLFSGSVLTENPSRNILFNQMSLNLITISLSKHFHNILEELVVLPGQGVDSYFCPDFFTGFDHLWMTSYYVTISINS